MSTGLQILRVVAVVGLIVGAAVLATPKGKLPLALRGVYRIMKRDQGARSVKGFNDFNGVKGFNDFNGVKGFKGINGVKGFKGINGLKGVKEDGDVAGLEKTRPSAMKRTLAFLMVLLAAALCVV